MPYRKPLKTQWLQTSTNLIFIINLWNRNPGRVLLDLFVLVESAGTLGGLSWVSAWSGLKDLRQHHLPILVPQCRHLAA